MKSVDQQRKDALKHAKKLYGDSFMSTTPPLSEDDVDLGVAEQIKSEENVNHPFLEVKHPARNLAGPFSCSSSCPPEHKKPLSRSVDVGVAEQIESEENVKHPFLEVKHPTRNLIGPFSCSSSCPPDYSLCDDLVGERSLASRCLLSPQHAQGTGTRLYTDQ